VIRALEVYHLTGAPISLQQAAATAPVVPYSSCFLVLTAARKQLYARINARVEAMIERGLVTEVRELLERGYHAGLNSMKSLGYKEITEFLAGKRDLASSITLIKRNTRHYAKRQLTWFRKDPTAHWISHESSEMAERTIERCLEHIAQWQKV
jgi:tRNA dimethylallyltransferase